MKKNRSRQILIFFVVMSFITACTPAGSEDVVPEVDSADVVATSVAATLAARELEENSDPGVSPTSAPESGDKIPKTDVLYKRISFTFEDLLADGVSSITVESNVSGDNPWFSTPEFIEFGFENWALIDCFHKPAIRVYPLNDFLDVNSTVSESIPILQNAIETGNLADEGIIVVDLFNASQFIKSQVKIIEFQNGRGIRYLTQYGQDAGPIGWPDLFYTYQGFTSDDEFYISVILPLDHPSLLRPDEVVLDDAFYENFMNYRAVMEEFINQLDPDIFVPSISQLDALIASLLVESPQ